MYIDASLVKTPKYKPFCFKSPNKVAVDTYAKMCSFVRCLSYLQQSTAPRPELCLDCEGTNLLEGKLTMLQLHITSLNQTFVFSLTKIGGYVFEMSNEDRISLRDVLQDERYLQGWWDPRADTYALWEQYDIKLGSVIDISLVEVASCKERESRNRRKRLGDAIQDIGPAFMSEAEIRAWVGAKRAGKEYCTCNGYEAFEKEEVPEVLWEYAAGYVDQLVGLFDTLWPKLSDAEKELVIDESEYWRDAAMMKPFGGPFAPATC